VAICRKLWTLIEVNGARGRHVTSWSSPRTNLRYAGAV